MPLSQYRVPVVAGARTIATRPFRTYEDATSFVGKVNAYFTKATITGLACISLPDARMAMPVQGRCLKHGWVVPTGDGFCPVCWRNSLVVDECASLQQGQAVPVHMHLEVSL